MQKVGVSRNSKPGCLIAMRDLGFNPNVVIDVNVQTGTEALFRVFLTAKHLMIEPVRCIRDRLLPNEVWLGRLSDQGICGSRAK